MRIIPKTKSNYLNLNGTSLEVKEYFPNKTNTGRVTCHLMHPELNKMVDVDFSENEVEIIEQRYSGYYWVKSKYGECWQIANYFAISRKFSYTDGKYNYESEIHQIDERQVQRL